MATVTFYEKRGCAGNARQKRLLEASGHQVIARDLLAEPWSAARLRSFFKQTAVRDWFNRSAPRVKSGAVDPDRLDADAALRLMLIEPLLIRRPLMEVGDERMVGFDTEAVRSWIGLEAAPVATEDLEKCRRIEPGSCATPQSASEPETTP